MDNACKEIDFSTISKDDFQKKDLVKSISFVPLEFNEDCAISRIQKLEVNKDTLFILSNDEISLFSMDGTFLHKFAHKGKGPGEYTSILDFSLDRERRLLYLLDGMVNTVRIYKMNGDYVNSFPIGLSLQIVSVGKNTILSDPGYIYVDQSANEITLHAPDKLLAMTVKGDVIKSYCNIFKCAFTGDLFIVGTGERIYGYQKRFYFNQFLSDTLYTINPVDFELHPYYTFKNVNTLPFELLGNQKRYDAESSKYKWIYKTQESDDFLFFEINESDRKDKVIYSKERQRLNYAFYGESKQDSLKKKPLYYWPDKIVDGKKMITAWTAIDFKEYYKNSFDDKSLDSEFNVYGINNFSGFYDSVNENDNPIIQITSLK